MNDEKSHGETDTVTKGWATIIFIQGEEATTLLHTLLRFDGVVTYQGATEESVAEVLAELQRWEDGEWFDVYDHEPWGPADGTFVEGDYVIAYNSHVGYVSLNRRVRDGWVPPAPDDGPPNPFDVPGLSPLEVMVACRQLDKQERSTP